MTCKNVPLWRSTSQLAAPQHGPRPLPLFLDMLRSETEGDPARRARVLEGLRRYQEVPRPRPARAGLIRFRRGRARLRDYGGEGRPVVFVPSLINPPAVLDLTPDTSLVRWMATRGIHAWLVDWGNPSPDDRTLDVAGHVVDRLVPLLRRLPEPPVLVGYCLGGTMALAAACLTSVAGLATIAAPWRFAGYGAARDGIAALWAAARPACEALGLVPVEVLQTGFWRMDPARTIAKYEAFARMEPGSAAAAAFIALEDWANAGAPLTFAAGAELFEAMLAADLPGTGGWRVAGATINPAALACPAVEFVSTTDRIVPAATAIGLADRRDVGAGHVGMIVGGGARTRLWAPLADWIAALPAPGTSTI